MVVKLMVRPVAARDGTRPGDFKSMVNRWRPRPMYFCLAALQIGLGACAANTIDVARRTSLSGVGKGTPFIVLLTDEEQADPDDVQYAALLVRQLEAEGLVAAVSSAQARYAVMMARSEPKPQRHDDSTDSTNDSSGGGRMGGGHGGGFSGRHGGHGMGGSHSGADQGTLRIAIFDLTKPRSRQERVFFAEVHVPADRQADDDVVAAMITAALKDFPGKSSESFSEPLPPKSAQHT